MQLSHFPIGDWVEIIAFHMDGIAAIWVNAILEEVVDRSRLPYTWNEFWTKIISRFESVMDAKKACREL